MNESASALLKIITALTSVKTSIRFIAIAVFLTLSWRYSELDFLIKYVPGEQKNIVFLLISTGLGSILGGVIYHLLHFIFLKTVGKYKLKVEHLKTQSIEKKEREKFLNNFIKTYMNFSKETKRVLFSLSEDMQNLCDDQEYGANLNALIQNNYIRMVSAVDSYSSIYELHPVLAEYLTENVPLEIDKAFYEFELDDEITKTNLIALLSGKLNTENLQSKTSEVISFCKRHNEILEYSTYYKDKEGDEFHNYLAGYNIWIDEFHVERFNEKFNTQTKGKVLIYLDEFRTK
jgi:hypothetical protein